MESLRLAKYAMGTRWEMVLREKSAFYLQGVGEAAFEELDRLEGQLSFYRENSDISDLNRRAFREPVLLEPRLFTLFQRAKQLHEQSGGAFDLTMGPLLRAWGFVGGRGEMPEEAAIQKARDRVGMEFLELNQEDRSVRFRREGMEVDLGAIGKGYALDAIMEHLREMEVTSALVHGGTSSVSALGSAGKGEEGWPIAIAHPVREGETLAQCLLQNGSLSVSAPRYKSFEQNGKQFGHVLDPATGRPSPEHKLAAVLTENAATGDALSTALLARGESLLPMLEREAEIEGALLLKETDGKPELFRTLRFLVSEEQTAG